MAKNYTDKDLGDFKRQQYKTHYSSNPKVKPTNGSLIHKQGNIETIIENDKPFALLQHIKNNMIRNGYKREHLIIKYKQDKVPPT